MYVDGFVIPIAKKNIKAYQRMAKQAGKIWKDHGALEFRECISDNLRVQKDMGLGFTKMARLKKGEAVLFSWVVYKNKAHQKTVMAKVMKDKRMANMCDPDNMPFELKRMAYGGFETIVDM